MEAAANLLHNRLLKTSCETRAEALSELLPRLQPCATCSLHRTITDLPVTALKALVRCLSMLAGVPDR